MIVLGVGVWVRNPGKVGHSYTLLHACYSIVHIVKLMYVYITGKGFTHPHPPEYITGTHFC